MNPNTEEATTKVTNYTKNQEIAGLHSWDEPTPGRGLFDFS
jgi:hypothetical protein